MPNIPAKSTPNSVVSNTTIVGATDITIVATQTIKGMVTDGLVTVNTHGISAILPIGH